MTDVLTLEQRKRNMASIRGKDTKPEIVVRRVVHSLGYRYGLHRQNLPGKPDIVLSRHQKVIFVHGCFWHKHTCRYGRVQPQTNISFWNNKRESNRLRDLRNMKLLRKSGWEVLVVWECWTKSSEMRRKLEMRLVSFLRK